MFCAFRVWWVHQSQKSQNGFRKDNEEVFCIQILGFLEEPLLDFRGCTRLLKYRNIITLRELRGLLFKIFNSIDQCESMQISGEGHFSLHDVK